MISASLETLHCGIKQKKTSHKQVEEVAAEVFAIATAILEIPLGVMTTMIFAIVASVVFDCSSGNKDMILLS